MEKTVFAAELREVGALVDYVRRTLERGHIRKNDVLRAMLVTEEAAVRLIEAAPEGAQLTVSVRCRYGTARIRLSAPGEAFSGEELQLELSGAELTDEGEEELRSLLLHAFADRISFTRRGERNCVTVQAGNREQVFAFRTAVSLAGGLIAGLLLYALLPASASGVLVDRVLLPIQTIFLNALQMVTAPAVFFSIMTSVAHYLSFSDSGRIGGKTIAWYFATSIAAVLVGIVLFRWLRPGTASETILAQLSTEGIEHSVLSEGLLEMVSHFIPDNIIAPFINTDAMQLLCFALLCGVSLKRVGERSPILTEIAEALDRFFFGIVELVSSSIPFSVFFTTMLMVLCFGPGSLRIGLSLLGTVLLGLLVMLGVYALLILFVARLDPRKFIVKYAPDIRRALLSGSGIDAIGDTIRCCQEKFGISHKVCSFSIPFGAIANLDGSCLYLTVAVLLLSKLCGAEVAGRELAAVVFIVVVLSVGAPLTPGSVVLALAVLINQVGAPLTALSLILGVNVILETALAVCNTVGSVAVSIIVARNEGLLDREVYNAPKPGAANKV